MFAFFGDILLPVVSTDMYDADDADDDSYIVVYIFFFSLSHNLLGPYFSYFEIFPSFSNFEFPIFLCPVWLDKKEGTEGYVSLSPLEIAVRCFLCFPSLGVLHLHFYILFWVSLSLSLNPEFVNLGLLD